MPLIPSTLSSSLTGVLGRPSRNGALKAREIAQAYQGYCLTATAGVLLPIFLGIEGQAMAARLTPVLTTTSRTPLEFARALANGVEAFWLLPPVLFSGGVAAGSVSAFVGKAALVSAVAAAMSAPTTQHEVVAIRLAGALDVATRTVTVTFAPPPGSTVTLT
jgi:hypothetical protein